MSFLGELRRRKVMTAGDTAAQPAATDAPAPHVPSNSIAVLPFVNMSTDADQEFFADGLTEDLLNRLAKVPGLRVPARRDGHEAGA